MSNLDELQQQLESINGVDAVNQEEDDDGVTFHVQLEIGTTKDDITGDLSQIGLYNAGSYKLENTHPPKRVLKLWTPTE